MGEFITVNLETGLPTTDEARKQLIGIINSAKREKKSALKIIHGYGSSGAGGILREALRKSLLKRRKEKLIQDYIYGENWSIFNENAVKWLDRFAFLKNDSDLNQGNPGITIIIL